MLTELKAKAVYPKKYLEELRSEINETKARVAAGEQPIFDSVDAFYSAANMAALNESIEEMRQGKTVTKTLEELETMAD